ncbi:TPA: hypothetical protein HA244_02820 [Candidatus Micrarchaeota archaeon]|nr:hypothetical protein [Candidatus Micrarchaeota archaeon]
MVVRAPSIVLRNLTPAQRLKLKELDSRMKALAKDGVLPTALATGHPKHIRREVSSIKSQLRFVGLTWGQRAQQLGFRVQSKVVRDYGAWKKVGFLVDELRKVSDLEKGVAPSVHDTRVDNVTQALLRNHPGLTYSELVHRAELVTRKEYSLFENEQRWKNRIAREIRRRGYLENSTWLNDLQKRIKERHGMSLEEWFESPIPKKPRSQRGMFYQPKVIEENEQKIRKIIAQHVEKARTRKILLRRAIQMHGMSDIARDQVVSHNRIRELILQHAVLLKPHFAEVGLDSHKVFRTVRPKARKKK